MRKWLPFIQLFQELELWKYCDWTFLFPLGKRSRENNFGGMGNIKQRIAGFKDLKFPYWKFINVFVFLVWVFSLWFWKRINVFWHRFLDVRFSTDAWQNDLFVNVVLFTFNHAVSCNAWIMLTSLHHPQNLSYFSRPFTSLDHDVCTVGLMIRKGILSFPTVPIWSTVTKWYTMSFKSSMMTVYIFQYIFWKRNIKF